MKTEDLRKPIPATGTIFSTEAFFDLDNPAAVAEAERLLRWRGYNTEILGSFAEQAEWDGIPLLIWLAIADDFNRCRGALDTLLEEVERIIDPLGGTVVEGADIFDPAILKDRDNWQDELFNKLILEKKVQNPRALH